MHAPSSNSLPTTPMQCGRGLAGVTESGLGDFVTLPLRQCTAGAAGDGGGSSGQSVSVRRGARRAGRAVPAWPRLLAGPNCWRLPILHSRQHFGPRLHKRQQCGPRPQKFGCRTLRGTRLIGCRKCRARQRPVRIPRHDGHDSGLMVDSVPAGWRTISLRRRTSHSRAAGQGSAAEFSVSGRPPRPAPARPGATVQVRLPNFCARCGGAE